ncbi:leucine-rich repeat protein [Geomicrobium sp. JCM 19039]|uniref:leucine-rich repeat protein n=1 Tax=Geomicrobium sp. JCM 19039 TaxID=1460636 RepID=UPI00045F46BB|nr:leucine-rich repeat protein [Geomicrobium sp. JCM 19039]GAK11615.1 hypothetical protein JCM19039_1322 [Geomicrobium sp. JCM 19039]
MRVKSIFFIMLLLVFSLGLWMFAYFLAESQNTAIKDPNLLHAVQQELQLEEHETLTVDRIQTLTSLDASGMQIESIEGIEQLDRLTTIDLSDNKISDLESIRSIDTLEQVDIRNNQVHDLSPLEELSQLHTINLRENNIQTLEPLAGLENLVNINIRENQIVDLSPLSEMELLEDLNARYNEITSIQPIIHLPALRQRLYVNGNPLEDVMLLSEVYDLILDIDIPRPEYDIIFSEAGGVYEDRQDIELSTRGEADGTIRYTTDGSEVTAEDQEYHSPIPVANSTTIRAQLFTNNEDTTLEYGQSYIIRDSPTLPIISISTDQANLYDEEYGIYTPGVYYNPDSLEPTGNYMQSGREWERPVFMQMFEDDETVLSQHAGIRIHGGHSRSVDRKSLRFYAREDYGNARFNHELFGEDERGVFNRFILRNSGQDWNRTLFRDAMMQELVSDLNMETQLSQPTNLYVNGENWGIFNIRERFDNHYFRFAHNVEEEDLDLLEGNGEVVEGDNRDYRALIDYVDANDMENDEHFDVVSTQMDMDNFLDYYIAQIYFGNMDWPQNNVNMWRER